MDRLYYCDILSARKACAVAAHLGSPLEWVYVDLTRGEQQAPAYLALNPNGKVPTLVQGERVLWEADAIMCRLARQAGSDLWPDDERQIEIIRWFSWSAQHFTRQAGELYFQNIIKARFGIGAPDPVAVEAALAGFRRFAAVLEAHLAGRAWLVGETLSVADFCVAVTLPYAEGAGLPLDEFPQVRRWHGRLNAMEAWRAPFPGGVG